MSTKPFSVSLTEKGFIMSVDIQSVIFNVEAASSGLLQFS